MAAGAIPPAPFLPSPDFLAWLDQLVAQPFLPLPLPLLPPDDPDD